MQIARRLFETSPTLVRLGFDCCSGRLREIPEAQSKPTRSAPEEASGRSRRKSYFSPLPYMG